MSSDQPGLCNLDFVPRYEQILAENLPENFTAFADFFAGTQRLHTLAAMLEQHVHGTGQRVLNVGSGPFATEIFVKALQQQTVVALDYTPEFAPFHGLFRQEGYLKNTSFLQADIMSEAFEPESFDLMILHDILYEPALDLEAVLTRLQPFLKPGGLVFFDFVNARTRWIWTMLGKPNLYRRYAPRNVKAYLSSNGYDILEWRPTHGAKSLSARTLHGTLRLAGASNNYAVLARKTGQ